MMQFISPGVSHLVLVLLVPLTVPAQVLPLTVERDPTLGDTYAVRPYHSAGSQLLSGIVIPPLPDDKAPRGMMFQEVLAKSMCHPMEQLVDVEQEFPGHVGYVYMPACVSLWRCSGCCGDENLECHPTLERNITVQMIRIAPMISSDDVELTFVEHQKCDCRARQTLLNYKSSSQESFRSKPRRRKLKKTETGCGKQNQGLYVQ